MKWRAAQASVLRPYAGNISSSIRPWAASFPRWCSSARPSWERAWSLRPRCTEPIRRADSKNSGGPRRYCDPYGRAGICPADGGEIRADDRFFAEHPELCGPASRGGRRFCGRGVGDSQLYQRRGDQIARAFFRTRNRGRPCADIGRRLRSRPAQEAGFGTPGAAQ